jgi:ABC-2 type transport system permease protein
MPNFRAYFKLIQLEATSPMSGGILYYLSRYAVRLIRTLLLLSIWSLIYSQAQDTSTIQLKAVLQYTLLAAIFWQQIDVQTSASSTFWEGNAASRYLRPLSIFGQYIAETIGQWIPGLLIFSLPVLLIAPLLGIDMRPADWPAAAWFMVSLSLGVLCGFAMDFILTGAMVFLGNAHYIASQIRVAFTLLLSGALIPLALLPFGLGEILGWLPFASMASAPLSIYCGTTDNPLRTVLLQLGWCLVLWLSALWTWSANRQKLVIFGG